jgi:hypothetical protein
VRATPRAKSNRIELIEGRIKIWVTAPPADGQANQAVRDLLADRLGIAPSRVSLIRGAASREKTFQIDGMTMDSVLPKF